jgi:hypothetical protein
MSYYKDENDDFTFMFRIDWDTRWNREKVTTQIRTKGENAESTADAKKDYFDSVKGRVDMFVHQAERALQLYMCETLLKDMMKGHKEKDEEKLKETFGRAETWFDKKFDDLYDKEKLMEYVEEKYKK